MAAHAKIDEQEKQTIYHMLATEKKTLTQIAVVFDVNINTIWYHAHKSDAPIICLGKTWQWKNGRKHG